MQGENPKFNPGRREFGKIALGGALGSAALLVSQEKGSATVHPNPPGIKIATSYRADPTDDDLLFLQQIGVEYVSLGATPETANPESFTRMRERYEAAGVKVYNVGSGVGPSGSLHNMPEVTLNLPGRDQKIEEYKQYLRNLGKAGIHYTTYAHMGNGIWSSGRAKTRGCDTPGTRSVEPQPAGRLGREGLQRAALARPRLYERGDLGELHLLHQTGGARRRRGGRADRDSPGRPAGRRCWPAFRAASSATSKATSGPWRSPTAPTSGICLCCGTLARRRQGADRQRSRGDDPLLRRAEEDLEDPFPQCQRALCRTSSKPSWITATTTCTRS